MATMVLPRSLFEPQAQRHPLKSLALALACAWFTLGETGCHYDVLQPEGEGGTGCDSTATVSYAQDIAPLLDLRCNGCHSGGAPSAGLDLATHETVALYATAGILDQRVSLPESDPMFMPKNGAPLDECDLGKLQRWTDNGAPNN
ncbi:MAG: hypothetical protein CL829_01385 [Crocinitomicaceae bacterium]|nr:hypothetical protein [Crocinitomicaceae bacterium]